MNLNKDFPTDTDKHFPDAEAYCLFLDQLVGEKHERELYMIEQTGGQKFGLVIKNAADDYHVIFCDVKVNADTNEAISFDMKNTGAFYTPHSALDHLCLQMKIETEYLQDKAHEEVHGVFVPGDDA